jgi:hypothetical protein
MEELEAIDLIHVPLINYLLILKMKKNSTLILNSIILS